MRKPGTFWTDNQSRGTSLKFIGAIIADTAPQTQYRQEFILGFEQMATVTRDTVTTEAVIKGNTAVFLVADSGGATAVTRGVNGLIPARADNLTQNSCTLVEWHDLVQTGPFAKQLASKNWVNSVDAQTAQYRA